MIISIMQYMFYDKAIITYARLVNIPIPCYHHGTKEVTGMSELFTPKTKEEFLASVDRGIAQAKNGQRQDAHEAVDEITRELEAGYNAMKAVRSAQSSRMAVVS